MKPTGAVLLLLVFCTITASSHKVPVEPETLDAVVEKEAHRVGVETVQTGEVLRAIADGIRATAQRQDGAESQSQQYFLNKLFGAVAELVKGAGNVVKGVAEGVGNAVGALTFSHANGAVTANAADILRKIVIKDLSLYASQDGKAHKDFHQQIADDLSHVAESLIKKGQALCSCRGRVHLDENEAKFVKMVVKAF